MQIKYLPLSLAMLFLLLHSPSLFAYNVILTGKAQEVQVVLDKTWQIADLATIALYPIPENMQATISLYDRKDKLKARAKFYYHTIKDKRAKQDYNAMLAHLGLSASLKERRYKLKISLTDQQGVVSETTFPITIDSKEFKTLTVKMGRQGTKIASKGTKPNAKRLKQSKDFYAALKSFSGKVYSTNKIMVMPVKKKHRISSQFGLKRTFLYSDGTKGTDFHNGIDFAGMRVGTFIYAIFAGKVVYAKERIVTGGTVIIEHLPGVYSLYYHMNTVNTVVGMKVRAGTFIGTLGSKGFSTGPHLHLGMYADGVDIDPSRFMSEPILDENFLLDKFKAIDIKLSKSLFVVV